MSKAGSGFDVCGGCHKSYKRLSTHISQNASCANHYTDSVDKMSSVTTAQNSCPTTNNSQSFSSAFNQRRSSSSGRKAPANKKEQLNEVPSNNDDEEFPPFDDQTAASNIDDDHLESDKEEDEPDESVLHLYEELFLLRSNPLGLEQFSREEKVQIEQMQRLKDLKVPLKAALRRVIILPLSLNGRRRIGTALIRMFLKRISLQEHAQRRSIGVNSQSFAQCMTIAYAIV
jgi:hypothetical protein